jgi:hypothetical protein
MYFNLTTPTVNFYTSFKTKIKEINIRLQFGVEKRDQRVILEVMFLDILDVS